MNRFLVLLGVCLLLTLHLSISAQITNTDCIGATPVCNNLYDEIIVPANEGFFPNELNPEISCIQNEIKNIWYSFTVNRTGKFGFLIRPNDRTVDYDWSMYNLTNASCADIFTTPSLLVSCNSAGGPGCNGDTGATGASSFFRQGGGCAAISPSNDSGRNTFNDLIDVVEGNTYVLTVSNFDRAPGGYTIDFSLSEDIGIIDNVNPGVADIVAEQGCAVSEVDILFSENIKCSSIAVENISLNGDATLVSSITSVVCDQGGISDSRFTVNFAQPLNATGMNQLQILPSDARAVTDLCDNSTGELSGSFQVTNDGVPPSLVDVIPDDPCQINSVTVNFSQAMLCAGVTNNSFTVTGPDGFISGATVIENCESSSSFVFEFDQPLLENAEYQLFINRVPGFDLTNECSLALSGDIMTVFRKVSQDGASLESADWSTDCAISELQLSFSVPIICSSISSANLSVAYQGRTVFGTIIDSDCDTETPMSLTELTFALDEALAINGTYDLTLTTNGVDEVLTLCGAPSPSGTLELNVDLMLEAPLITDVSFPDSCNIQTMTLAFSKEVRCGSGAGNAMNLDYAGSDISLRPTISDCDLSASISLDLSSVINGDGDFVFDYMQTAGAFVDACGTAAASANLVGSLSFNNCDSCFVYVPNAFSPNGDSVNDSLGPLSNCEFDTVSMFVFDRWGNQVYNSQGATISWDGLFGGDTIEPGVYAYIIEIDLREFRRSSSRTLTGTFTVM